MSDKNPNEPRPDKGKGKATDLREDGEEQRDHDGDHSMNDPSRRTSRRSGSPVQDFSLSSLLRDDDPLSSLRIHTAGFACHEAKCDQCSGWIQHMRTFDPSDWNATVPKLQKKWLTLAGPARELAIKQALGQAEA